MLITLPVMLNVPVCARPLFRFFKDKKDVAAEDTAARPRSSLGRRTAHPAAGHATSIRCRHLAYNK
jgi:hypothetical protein